MALAKSYNTVPVRLAKDVLGTQVIVDTAKAMGVATPLRSDKTIPLGTSEVTVLDQATAYAVFPADGMQSRRHGIEQVLDYEGNVLYDFSHNEPPAKRVLSEDANSKMNQMLVTIPVMGTARRGALDNGIVSGGKTGTSQAYRDAWYVGFTGNYTTAVWFGNDEFTPMNNMTGGALPAMAFKRLMDYAHQGMEPAPHPRHPEPVADRRAPAAFGGSGSRSHQHPGPAGPHPPTLALCRGHPRHSLHRQEDEGCFGLECDDAEGGGCVFA